MVVCDSSGDRKFFCRSLVLHLADCLGNCGGLCGLEGHYLGAGCGWMVLHTAAIAAQTVATGVATTAQTGLNLAMLAFPLTWIIVGIAAVVAAILWLANAVGGFDVLMEVRLAGIQVAFYYAAGAITSGFWWMVYGLMWAGDKLITFWEEVKMAAYRIFNAIADFFGQVGASIMLGLEAIVNGAIWILNQFIGGINAISESSELRRLTKSREVDFGRKAQAQADAAAAMCHLVSAVCSGNCRRPASPSK